LLNDIFNISIINHIFELLVQIIKFPGILINFFINFELIKLKIELFYQKLSHLY